MPCYDPLRCVLVQEAEGCSISFSRSAIGKALSLPCGRCIGCRLERARQWAVRLMHEAKMHDDNYFASFTYDDKNLPKGRTLLVDDCQLFFKRFRKAISPIRIKFFMAGEYGEEGGRPHYHAIIFGYSFPDKVLLESRGEYPEWTSPLLMKAWGKGAVHLGTVTFDSACYVANYATKKITGEKAAAHYQGRKPEFCLMSRGGRTGRGIGYSWLQQFQGDVYPSDEVMVKGHPARPPRYYDNIVDPKILEAVKVKRLEKTEVFQLEVGESDVINFIPTDPSESHPRRLAVRKIVAEAKYNLRKRNLEKNT